ncbi:MAG: hypothetical protein LC733_13285, partial [Actinobacteria bacterium]|nr:hypothetical protein [Actinomycetota bacterium]
MADRIWSLPLAELELALTKLPSVTTWSRLEPISLSSDLQPGLQALLGDPLWLLGRQWQFDELRGEDGGTPVATVVDVEHAPLARLHPGPLPRSEGRSGPRPRDQSVDIADSEVPLEALVEAEVVERPAERIRAEAGLQLLRMLTAADLAPVRAQVVTRWAFPPAAPDDQDPAGTARAAVHARRIPDAERIEADLAPLDGGAGPLTGLPSGVTV